MKLSDIDKNFKIPGLEENLEADVYNVKENTFCLFGIMADDVFRRIPQDVADNTNEGVAILNKNTAGGRLRFKTDSEFISLKVKYPSIENMNHMPRTGSGGFDVYADGIFWFMIAPVSTDCEESVGGTRHFGSKKMREITINFPLYNCVDEVYLGLEKGSVFEKASDFDTDKPIVFYGSSITQGGCVSRPGNSYPAIVARKVNSDYINLGFSGSGKAEDIMGDYIANLPMSVFVMDYDHNAPNIEYLEKTHEKFFKQIREKNKDLPIVIVSMPDIRFWNQYNDNAKIRRDIIKKTYENAVKAGDKHVYFVDGETLFYDEEWDLCTVDRCHPNDLGHYCMAQKILPFIKKALNIR